jgi:gametolysin peptidase M11
MRRFIFALLLILPACIPADAKPKPQPTTIPPTTTTTVSTESKSIAVLLINFADDPRQPWTPVFIDSLYDGPGASVANLWEDTSFGQLQVSSDVFGWFTIAVTKAQCPSSQNAISDQADAAATAAGVNLNLYTNISYLWPDNGISGCRSGGQMPGTRTWVALQTTCSEATGVCAARYMPMHEFGHNLGLNHAGNEAGQYTDSFDVMGCCGKAQTSNIHRAFMGWIPPSQVVTVTGSTTLSVTRANDPTSNVYRISNGTDYYYIENRGERTVWENGTGAPWPGGMLLIRVAPDYTIPAVTTLLDLNPNTSPTQVGLPVGSSYTMPNGVVITNLAFDGTNNTVQIGSA